MIKIKRGLIFSIGLLVFLTPGQNWYLTLDLADNPSPVEAQTTIFEAADYPVKINQTPPPYLTAKSVAIIDYASGVPIYTKDENSQLLPASTSKIMTALVAMDYYPLNQVLTLERPDHLNQLLHISAGEKFTVESLLHALLISSANDVGNLFAENYPGGQAAFVEEMNKKAQEYHLQNTFFANPTGLDSDDRGELLAVRSYSTAIDLARLAAVALRNDLIKKIVATKSEVIYAVGTGTPYQLYNVNTLLSRRDDIQGIKTGWTEQAGECLVGLAVRDGRQIISVVLGSEDRFGETEKLVDWAFANFNWQTPQISFED